MELIKHYIHIVYYLNYSQVRSTFFEKYYIDKEVLNILKNFDKFEDYDNIELISRIFEFIAMISAHKFYSPSDNLYNRSFDQFTKDFDPFELTNKLLSHYIDKDLFLQINTFIEEINYNNDIFKLQYTANNILTSLSCSLLDNNISSQCIQGLIYSFNEIKSILNRSFC